LNLAIADRARLQPQSIPKNLDFNSTRGSASFGSKHFPAQFGFSVSPLRLNSPFWVQAEINSPCAKVKGFELLIDMPQHGHGPAEEARMPRKELGNSTLQSKCRFEVQNIHLHMPGWWRFCILETGAEPKNENCIHRKIFN
jgi:hypothetical protein